MTIFQVRPGQVLSLKPNRKWIERAERNTSSALRDARRVESDSWRLGLDQLPAGAATCMSLDFGTDSGRRSIGGVLSGRLGLGLDHGCGTARHPRRDASQSDGLQRNGPFFFAASAADAPAVPLWCGRRAADSACCCDTFSVPHAFGITSNRCTQRGTARQRQVEICRPNEVLMRFGHCQQASS
jgi:hypothetical protein